MRYHCPSCHSVVDAATWMCSNGHAHATVEGVVRLVTPAFAAQMKQFLPALQDYRTRLGRRLLDPAAYPALPGGAAVAGDREWQQRQYDLALIERMTAGRKSLRVLDLGAYNGWLSHHLARGGHAVTGVDPFTDPYDGLGAAQFYAERWLPMQLDLRDLTVLADDYDLVVVNRCLAFFPEPAVALRQAQALVAPGGRLVALGVQVFAQPARKAARVQELDEDFQQRYGLSAYLWPTRGYLDRDDQRAFAAAGLRLRPQRELWAADLRARLNPSLPRHYVGTWSRDAH